MNIIKVSFLLVIVYTTVLSAPRYIESQPVPSLPASVENQKLPFFPPIISQSGESCANASGIGYVVTYELNRLRYSPANDASRRYSYFATYNFLNDGTEENGTYTMFIDAWNMVQSNGIMSESDFGDIEPRSTKWVSGYDQYLDGMKNRIEKIDSLSFRSDSAFSFFKQYLYNHRNGASAGGIFIITAIAIGIQDAFVINGPHQGSYIVRSFGKDITVGKHALTVTGYNDEVALDMNRDGAITSTVDINKDGKIDMKDNERGAFICANTWGFASGDSGFMYVPYSLFAQSYADGGLISPYGYFITAKKEYTPTRTLRVRLSHKQRNALSLSVGCSGDSSAAIPSFSRIVKQFDHAGGALPMCGKDAADSIEVGIDISDLTDSLGNSSPRVYFLTIDARDNQGKCNALSLYDYTVFPPRVFTCETAPRSLSTGKNVFRIDIPVLGVRNSLVKHYGSGKIDARIARHVMTVYTPGILDCRFFTVNGQRINALPVAGAASKYTLPGLFGNGVLLVKGIGQNGAVVVQKISVWH